MHRDNKPMGFHPDNDDMLPEDGYFTYRPLSNLPTPPPSSRQSSVSLASQASMEDGEILHPRYTGPAIHLVNLIPSSASLATASVPLVQAMLSRANLPIETVALAVCILDSLDAKFARTWRLSCPISSSSLPMSTANKRQSLPPTPSVSMITTLRQQQQFHIDSVGPEIIVLSALVIAAKFTEDPQESSSYYCAVWGKGLWSADQLNVTERCIMERLGYRIMPLCDEDVLAGAMVDMQLAAQEQQRDWMAMQPSPPESLATPILATEEFIPSHSRSKTMAVVEMSGPLSPFDIDIGGHTSQVSTPMAR